MKKNSLLTTSLLLGVISAVLAVAVFMVNSTTANIIAESEATKLNSYYESIFPDSEYEVIYDNKKDKDKSSNIISLATATKDGNVLGYLYLAYTTGYSSDVVSLIGINATDSKLVKVIVTKQTETPGLGTLATAPKFLDQFSDKSTDEELKAKDNITAITGATITSTAVVNSVNEALADFNTNYKK
ncbi:MAG: electron transport complex protein RnfG [Fusobacteria bacterium]|nr:MAG: electron transport complex protein RnfG [Fusobacteriota bacterium]KAF0229662.1 MAG: electron transport complex protein [Fusobacteriota bacterium]